MDRFRLKFIQNDLTKKLVFLVGPRQVGKTWLAKEIGKHYRRPIYLNPDSHADRQVILREGWPVDSDLLVLDEIHKLENWKSYLKGVYDTRKPNLHLLVTGSARLETFRHSGDSMAGRFFTHHLMPVTWHEWAEVQGDSVKVTAAPPFTDQLLSRGGFPEPLLAPSIMDADRWRRDYIDGLLRDDVLDFSNLHDLRSLKLVFEILRRRVGSPVSFSSIARDAGLAPNTVRHYLEVFEALFICFRVSPHSRNIGRSLLKEPKVYFYDTGLVLSDGGARLENAAAVALLDWVWRLRDLEGKDSDLRYLRTREGREVDFCVVVDDEPLGMVEVKSADREPSANPVWFHKNFGIPAVQILPGLRQGQDVDGISIRNLEDWLAKPGFIYK